MTYSIRITSIAHRDLVRQGQYLAERNPAAARRFLKAVQQSCRRLQDSPDLGEIWNDGATPDETYRCWSVRGFENYVLFYRIRLDTIEISRVLHAAQDADRELNQP